MGTNGEMREQVFHPKVQTIIEECKDFTIFAANFVVFARNNNIFINRCLN
jgi:hypothetical protein